MKRPEKFLEEGDTCPNCDYGILATIKGTCEDLTTCHNCGYSLKVFVSGSRIMQVAEDGGFAAWKPKDN